MLGNDLNYLVLSFDLDTKKLKEYYSKSRRNAYREIQQFLESNGFEHRQWSGYISTERMDMQDVYPLLMLFKESHPWMEHCANRFDASEVKDKGQISLLDCFSSRKKETIFKGRPKTFTGRCIRFPYGPV